MPFFVICEKPMLHERWNSSLKWAPLQQCRWTLGLYWVKWLKVVLQISEQFEQLSLNSTSNFLHIILFAWFPAGSAVIRVLFQLKRNIFATQLSNMVFVCDNILCILKTTQQGQTSPGDILIEEYEELTNIASCQGYFALPESSVAHSSASVCKAKGHASIQYDHYSYLF